MSGIKCQEKRLKFIFACGQRAMAVIKILENFSGNIIFRPCRFF
ncbi:Uncharacterized protein dnm_085110 [Desulfonema magnum]|uniref:Uncharacterized protein n=1 Tax=Desulfonema magnum TaxID=45655 RepID=A0A975BVB4_9BACT|nr:Uncharacterized protein dnm_085110 [Desulfonema magnum]